MPRKQLAEVIEQVLEQESDKLDLDSSMVDDYKKLNDKCDVVIGKIKNRKKRKNKTAGE